MSARALKKPRLVFETTLTRRRYGVRFRLQLIIILAAAGALYALDLARREALVDMLVWDIGFVAGGVLMSLLVPRALVNLLRWFRRRDETLRFYDQGFVWQMGEVQHQYPWSKLRTIREAGKGIYLGGRPLMQWGAQVLTMTDKTVFRIEPHHGNLRLIARAIRPHAAAATGTRMARLLRQEIGVPLHPPLKVWPGGVEAGKHEIPWSDLDVALKGGRLIIRVRGEDGKFHTVKRYRGWQVDNLGGFIEVVASTLPNHQPERFNRKSPAPTL